MSDDGPALTSEIAALRAQLQERDDLLAIAAHELRNPLHGLSLQLALAQARAQSRGQLDIAESVAKAQKQLLRYGDRMTVLLDLVTLNAQAYPLSPRRCDLAELLTSIADGLASEAALRRLRITTEVPAHCWVDSDPVVIGQVVDNLLLNALKHSGAQQVVVRLRSTESHASIAVVDNGVGIGEAEQARIFGKFEMARAPSRQRGSGLGLWIVRKLAHALGGEVSLRSQPGAGATFEFSFPVSADTSAESPVTTPGTTRSNAQP